jgi:hypothetical protein
MAVTTHLRAVLWILCAPAAASAQTLRSFEFREDTIVESAEVPARDELITGEYEVFADGNIKDVVGGNPNETTASGSLGIGYSSGQFTVNLLVNAVGTATPLRENFGSALLAPAAGSSLNAGVLDIRWSAASRPTSGLCGTYGLRGYASVSSAQWQPDTSGAMYGVVTPGAGLGAFCQLLAIRDARAGDKEPRSLAAVLDLGLAVRGIAGDIAQSANDSIRVSLLADDRRTRVGVEVGLGLQLNGLKAALTLYAFPGETPGLSDGQVIAGFSVQSALLSGKIRRTPTTADRNRLTR